MTTQIRVSGYVVGYDKVKTDRGLELLWTVKVKDIKSEFDGRKFLVVSQQPGTMVTMAGKAVTFRIAPVEVESELVLRAVNVAIGPVMDIVSAPQPDEQSLTINVCAVQSEGGELEVFNTGLETIEQAQCDLNGNDRTVIAFRAINCEPADQPEEVLTGLRIIAGLSHLDGTLHALDYLFQEVFELGRQSVTNCS